MNVEYLRSYYSALSNTEAHLVCGLLDEIERLRTELAAQLLYTGTLEDCVLAAREALDKESGG